MNNKKIVFLLFCAAIFASVVVNISILYPLCAGLGLFLLYGRMQGFSWKELLRMCLAGIRTIGGMLVTFLLIGVLTAMWRISGCIPAIVCYASGLIHPRALIVLSFLLCCLVSVLTGTAFGTAATMGVICVSIAKSMNASVFWVGGAVLAGAYFGDRCSPVSTSALLVCQLTRTDIYSNIRRMVRTALVPFLLSCAIYALVGCLSPAEGAGMDVSAMFREVFTVHPVCLLPAAVILILALFHLKVRWLMITSILVSLPIAAVLQGAGVGKILHAMLLGYQTQSETLAPMINGGGVISMVRVSAIIGIASCYAGIFEKTGLLSFVEDIVRKLSAKVGTYIATLLIALPVSAVACNQTLAIILTDQLTHKVEHDPETQAIHLENSAVVVAALIPWSIAAEVSLTSAGATTVSVLTACYLYLLPLLYALSGAVRKKS